MKDSGPEQRELDGAPILLLFLIGLVGVILVALLHLTGGFDFTVFL